MLKSKSSTSIIAVGAALVDILSYVKADFIYEQNLEVGSMHLTNLDTSKKLYANISAAKEMAGGSSANTAAIAANLGASTSFMGKTCKDQLGEIFWHDMKAQGITTLKVEMEKSAEFETGRCLSMIEKDGQRTMATYLGACTQLTCQDAESHNLQDKTDWLFLESYLLDSPNGRDLVSSLMTSYKGPIALTLSDAHCVTRHHAFLMNQLPNIDLLFGNEKEFESLLSISDPKEAVEKALKSVPKVACTNGSKGVWIGEDNTVTLVPAQKAKVVDTTGAGDSFAGTCLWGLTTGLTLMESAQHGVKIAGYIVSQVGGQPMVALSSILDT